jgi:hypothetical protein
MAGGSHFDVPTGRVVIQKRSPTMWTVSFYPPEGHPDYPGFTIDSAHNDVPSGPDEATVLAWVEQQAWTKS